MANLPANPTNEDLIQGHNDDAYLAGYRDGSQGYIFNDGSFIDKHFVKTYAAGYADGIGDTLRS